MNIDRVVYSDTVSVINEIDDVDNPEDNFIDSCSYQKNSIPKTFSSEGDE